VTDKPDDYKTKADEYENLADAAVDPEEKKKLKDLARTARNLAPEPGPGRRHTRSIAARASAQGEVRREQPRLANETLLNRFSREE
jgi:hypothetical protein